MKNKSIAISILAIIFGGGSFAHASNSKPISLNCYKPIHIKYLDDGSSWVKCGNKVIAIGHIND